jgi:Tol biopolymer transport system component
VVFAVAGDGVWMVVLDGRMHRVISEGDVDAFAWAPGGRQIAFRTARDGQWKLQIVRP